MNNWHGSLRQVKMQQGKEREKRFVKSLSGRKSMHFSGNKILRKMYGKEQCRKRKAEKG
jgi:hypothetical protein